MSTPATPAPAQHEAVLDLLRAGRVTVLSGAGLSTESGIPAYRGPDGQRRASPMTVSELLADPAARQRYWARAHVGWPRFSSAQPNDGHRAVARLQRGGHVGTVITQNVDGLHQRAGGRDVLELHGSLSWVVCVACGRRCRRGELERRLADLNPGMNRTAGVEVRPDGDVQLPDEVVRTFRVATCTACGSDLLKPDVVMFGESVAPELVARCYAAVEQAGALLVLGSSLMVMSGLRFVRRAVREQVPVAIVTQGVTRADDLVPLRLDAPLGPTLTALADALGAPA